MTKFVSPILILMFAVSKQCRCSLRDFQKNAMPWSPSKKVPWIQHRLPNGQQNGTLVHYLWWTRQVLKYRLLVLWLHCQLRALSLFHIQIYRSVDEICANICIKRRLFLFGVSDIGVLEWPAVLLFAFTSCCQDQLLLATMRIAVANLIQWSCICWQQNVLFADHMPKLFEDVYYNRLFDTVLHWNVFSLYMIITKKKKTVCFPWLWRPSGRSYADRHVANKIVQGTRSPRFAPILNIQISNTMSGESKGHVRFF